MGRVERIMPVPQTGRTVHQVMIHGIPHYKKGGPQIKEGEVIRYFVEKKFGFNWITGVDLVNIKSFADWQDYGVKYAPKEVSPKMKSRIKTEYSTKPIVFSQKKH